VKRLLLLLLLPLLLASCEGGAPKLNTGDKAPAFSGVKPDGSAVTFPGNYAGKPVVIRFWAEQALGVLSPACLRTARRGALPP